MPKTIREIYTDISGNVSVEYSDDSIRNFNLADTSVIPVGIAVSGNKTLSKTDLEQVQDCSAATALTIPNDAVLGIFATDRVTVAANQMSAGAVSWVAGAGVSPLRRTAPTAEQYLVTGLVHVGANEWAYL